MSASISTQVATDVEVKPKTSSYASLLLLIQSSKVMCVPILLPIIWLIILSLTISYLLYWLWPIDVYFSSVSTIYKPCFYKSTPSHISLATRLDISLIGIVKFKSSTNTHTQNYISTVPLPNATHWCWPSYEPKK